MVAITEAKGGDMAYFWNKGGGGGGRYNGTKGGVRFRNEGVLTILFTNYEAT